MLQLNWIPEIVGIVLVCLSMVINGERMWFKNELKFLIEPGYRECFYQHVERDTVFHASFQVIKGDGVGLEVIDPKGITLLALNNEPTGSHQIQTGENDGVYAICIDNSYSHLTSKLVSIYILTFQQNLMHKKMLDDRLLNETHNAVVRASNTISMNIVEMLTHQAMARFRSGRDEYTIESNNSLIVYWSCFQSFLIVLCGCFQVYFVKRLFLVSKSTRTAT